jgi:hydrogenase nickel incorporation protein HypA/HybF
MRPRCDLPLRLLSGETEFEPLRLEIDYCSRKHRCRDCGRDFSVQDYDLQRPKCHSLESDCIGGDELDLAFGEVEEYAAN